jgi:Holliday junction resolvase RusA-like endonuclease
MIEASTKLKPWRASIRDAVLSTFVATGDDSSFTEPVIVRATFYLPRPKSVKRLWPSVAPDLDKLCRSLGDALSIDTKVLADDSLIVKWHAVKVYADDHDAGVRVAIRTVSLADQDKDFLNITLV